MYVFFFILFYSSNNNNKVGVILPNDKEPNPGNISNIYWNAAGAMYAYIFGNIIYQQVGMSLLNKKIHSFSLLSISFSPLFYFIIII